MPFESKAQRRWMYANKPEMAKRWEKHTPKGKKLPERVKKGEAAALKMTGYDNLEVEGSGPAVSGPAAQTLLRLLDRRLKRKRKLYINATGRPSRWRAAWRIATNSNAPLFKRLGAALRHAWRGSAYDTSYGPWADTIDIADRYGPEVLAHEAGHALDQDWSGTAVEQELRANRHAADLLRDAGFNPKSSYNILARGLLAHGLSPGVKLDPAELDKLKERLMNKQAALTPEMIGAGIGATGAGLAAYLLSKKNKARNTLLAILGGGLGGSAAGAGYNELMRYKDDQDTVDYVRGEANDLYDRLGKQFPTAQPAVDRHRASTMSSIDRDATQFAGLPSVPRRLGNSLKRTLSLGLWGDGRGEGPQPFQQ